MKLNCRQRQTGHGFVKQEIQVFSCSPGCNLYRTLPNSMECQAIILLLIHSVAVLSAKELGEMGGSVSVSEKVHTHICAQ